MTTRTRTSLVLRRSISLAVLAVAPSAVAQQLPQLPSLPPVPSGGGAAALTQLPRTKTLRTSLGMEPSQADFGEGDLVTSVGTPSSARPPKKWNLSMHGFFRAPALLGIGPRNDGTEGRELHSPPRVVGADPGEWNAVGLTPEPVATFFMAVENRNVKGTLIMSSDTFFDPGFQDLVKMGGIDQGYVTVRLPDVFGNRGGLAFRVGAFSNRYGNAGPNQQSTGYYGASLFGRTHVGGYAATVDYDLTSNLRLVGEQGFGTKLDVQQFEPPDDNPPLAPYLPYQGPVPQGSNFVHHAHLGLEFDEKFRFAIHHLMSLSPNDRGAVGVETESARLSVLGAELAVDHPLFGNGFLGYSRTDAKDILPLANGLEVMRSESGYDFARNFFPQDLENPELPEATGTVDTILAQYILRLRPLLGQTGAGPDVAWAVYGMFNHITTPTDFEQDRFKFGTEVQVAPLSFMTVGARYDFVRPDGSNGERGYSAISPRMLFHSTFMSREYILLSYSHYFLGDDAFPSAPYADLAEADPDQFSVSAVLSF